MKKLLIITMLMMSINSIAQYRLNITKHDLKKEFSDLQHVQTNTDTLVYARNSSLGLILYYLKDDVTFMTAIFPTDNVILKDLIKEYDLKYIRATPNTWEQYLANGVVSCSLHQGDDHKWFFIFIIK
jgi:hypothetical protein